MESTGLKQFSPRSSVACFPSLTLVFAALHYYWLTEMNRPWPAAVTVLTKYLPVPLEEAALQQDDRLSLLRHDDWDKACGCLDLLGFYGAPTVLAAH